MHFILTNSALLSSWNSNASNVVSANFCSHSEFSLNLYHSPGPKLQLIWEKNFRKYSRGLCSRYWVIYRVKVLSAWSTLLKWLSLSTLLALEVMTPQKRKTKAILLWWMVSLTCLISPLSIVHISEQGPYDIYTIRLKAIERAPLIYLKELQFSISESRPKANEFWNFDSFLIIPVIFIFIRHPSRSIASET